MQAKHYTTAALVLIAVATAFGQTLPGRGNPGPVPTRLAVINVGELFARLNEMSDAYRDIEVMRAAAMKEIDKRKADIERLTADIDNPNLFRKDSPEVRRMQEEALQKSLDLRSHTEFSQQKLFLELRLRTLLVNRKIEEAIAAHARSTGLALVLATEEFNLSNTRTQQEMQAALMMRKVMYLHPQYDITRDVLTQMNTAYGLKK